MIEFLRKLFLSDFMNHGYCYLWRPDIIWLHAASDGLIALAYYFIPVALVYFVRKRRDLPFHWMFFMFGLFIFGCGTTHAMEIWTLWHGTYRLAGVVKALTATASVATAVALVPLIPRALLLPTPRQLRAANLELEREIAERKRAEEALRENEQRLLSIYNTVRDVIFHLAVEPEGQFRFVSVNTSFLGVTGLSMEMVVGKMVNEVIPEPSLTMVVDKYRQAIENGTTVVWEETSHYPSGQLTGEVSAAPVFDDKGTCTHLVGSVHDITHRKRAEEIENQLASNLAASRDEIRALAASLIRAQEDERRRVSRELHDQICHQLGYLASDIGNLADGPLARENLRAQLKAIRARVVKTSQETHDIAYQMHTAILKDLGLVASLKALCRQFSDQYPNIAADFENSGPPTSIPIEVATCLYRVAQESLQNTAKHSGAKNVWVRLGLKERAIVLTMQDNGAGFDSKAIKGHGGIGLISMKERAYSVNGELTIASQPGHGTQVTLEIPLPASGV